MATIYQRPNPVGIDRPISMIQEGLAERLPWLEAIFGRSERRVKAVSSGGAGYYFPAVYVGHAGYRNIAVNEYISAEPSDVLGNSCFFEVDDPQNYSNVIGDYRNLTTTQPVSIVFWYDSRKIFPLGERNTEDIRLQILNALVDINSDIRLGMFSIAQTFQRTENIYRGYGLREVDTQYLTHPYAGIRVSGSLIVEEIYEC